MAKTIPDDALVLVADGGKAILLRNKGHGGALSLKEERRLTLADFTDDGPSGSAPEDQTPQQTGEATFAKKLAQMLEKMNARKDFDALVVIAAPQTLGELRKAMHKTVEQSIVQSVSKDLTNQSLQQIEHALAA